MRRNMTANLRAPTKRKNTRDKNEGPGGSRMKMEALIKIDSFLSLRASFAWRESARALKHIF